MFHLKNVTKLYDATAAVLNIDLDVPPGQATILIGPSGCGKSTLLRLMTGLTLPDSGTVVFEGRPLTPEHLAGMRPHMGYVIQEGGLFPHLTGTGNVTLMARYLRRPKAQIAQRIEQLCRLTRLEPDVLRRFPAEMSGGQRQRVALMRALMLDPDVLLLDEPLSGALDPMVRFELQNDLADIFHQLNKTVVMVTHDMREAGFFGDSIVLLREGQIVQQGTLDDLLNRPAEEFVERFIRAQRSSMTCDV